MFQVTLDIFSGRENPSVFIDAQEARALAVEFSRHQRILTKPEAGYQGLGWRGVIIEAIEDTLTQRYNLPAVFKIASGASDDEAKAQEIAARLISITESATLVRLTVNVRDCTSALFTTSR